MSICEKLFRPDFRNQRADLHIRGMVCSYPYPPLLGHKQTYTMSSKRRAPFIPPNGSSTSKQCPTVTLKMRRGSKKMLRGTPLIRTRATRDTHTHLIACPVVASRISHLAPRMRHDHMTAHRSACRRPKVAAPWAAPLRRAQSRRTPSTPKLGRRVAAYAQGPRRAGE